MASDQDSSSQGQDEQREQNLAEGGVVEQQHDDGSGDNSSGHDRLGQENAAAASDGQKVFDTEDLAALSDLTGKMVGHYFVQAKLGGGAMAAVYRANDHLHDREVALKVLLPGADETTRERFRREARMVSQLEHPNIVKTYQVGQTSAGGVTYIAMELVTGNSLADLLERTGKLGAVDACALLQPVAQALEYAHKRDVVHRDVKPSNILLRRVKPGTPHSVRLQALDYPVVPLLSDFGIARALDAPELTSVGRTIGTPAFMSPEQCAGSSEIDGRADIYSLGTVLYRCIVGRAPYVGTTTQILHAHVYDPLLIPDDILGTLPPTVIEILKRAMTKAREQRYPSAALMAQDLASGGRAALERDKTAEQRASAVLDSTMTMASLPATGADTANTSSTVLVPASVSQGSAGKQSGPPVAPQVGNNPLMPRSGSITSQPVIPIARQPVQRPPKRRPARAGRLSRGGIGLVVLSFALLALLVVLSVTLVNSILPATDDPATVATGQSANLPSEGANPPEQVGTPADGTDEAPAVVSGNEITVTGTSGASGTGEVATEIASGPPDVASTVTVTPTLVVAKDFAWDNAQAFYAEEAWEEALNWLIAVRRKDDTFEKEQVDEMLYNTYVALATQAALGDELGKANENLEEVLQIYPDDASVQRIRDAFAGYVDAPAAESDSAREALQQAYAEYAAVLDGEGKHCRAFDQLTVAIRLFETEELLARQAVYTRECGQEETLAALEEMSGTMLYSSQRGDTYQIFTMNIEAEPTSRLLIDNGSQPSLHPSNNDTVAFYSTRGDYHGLSGFSIRSGLEPNDRVLRYSDFTEDARDSPPSWNPLGDRLVYSSDHEGDNRFRIYLTWADGSRNTQTLGFGKDPAWHPTDNLIVYNGVDETGNNPGLWLVQADGSGRTRITDNGNDIRPTWTPDGNSIVFMSQGRDGNWELYRVDVADYSVIRLTDNPAQDGLPTVSPDGTQVAYMSDREGVWRIWYVSIDGGEERLLGGIVGQLTNWLEHAIQWVE